MKKNKQAVDVREAEIDYQGVSPAIIQEIYHSYSIREVQLSRDFEHPTGVSLTIPDHTMTIREIVSRFGQGRGINASVKEPVFHGDEIDIPDTKKMDLVEVQQMLESVRDNRALLEHQLELEKTAMRNLELAEQEKLKKEEDERLLKLYEERLRNQKQ